MGTTPIVSGLPAVQCIEPDCCFCKTTFADVFSDWICPHCGSHLSAEDRVCLNLCGLSYPAAMRFQSMIANEAGEAKREFTD